MTKRIGKPTRELHNESEGSPTQGEPIFLAIGILRKPHGVQGEIFLEVHTDLPENIQKNKIVYVGEKYQRLFIKSTRRKDHGYLILFDGINNLEKIDTFRNRVVFVKSTELLPLKTEQYYYHQIIGLNVEDDQHGLLGKIIEIQKTGSNDVYIIEPIDKSKKEILIPAIKSVIKKIDLENSLITVVFPDWG